MNRVGTSGRMGHARPGGTPSCSAAVRGAATSLCAAVAGIAFPLGVANDVPPESASEASTG
eukprot:13949505-Heterocapsa_arctica.AAC.1